MPKPSKGQEQVVSSSESVKKTSVLSKPSDQSFTDSKPESNGTSSPESLPTDGRSSSASSSSDERSSSRASTSERSIHVTIFETPEIIFPDVDRDNDIPILPFLAASKVVASLFDLFGKLFLPLKYDMLGNVSKLEKARSQYMQEKEAGKLDRETQADNEESTSGSSDQRVVNEPKLLQLIEAEGSPTGVATDALLWLKRGLDLLHSFFRGILETQGTQFQEEDIRPLLENTYERKLKDYHSWIVQKFFYMVSKSIPYRSELLRSLANGNDANVPEMLQRMKIFLDSLFPILELISERYLALGLNTTTKAWKLPSLSL